MFSPAVSTFGPPFVWHLMPAHTDCLGRYVPFLRGFAYTNLFPFMTLVSCQLLRWENFETFSQWQIAHAFSASSYNMFRGVN
jgi:hypothetical protein